jgi:hypothetical protein
VQSILHSSYFALLANKELHKLSSKFAAKANKNRASQAQLYFSDLAWNVTGECFSICFAELL